MELTHHQVRIQEDVISDAKIYLGIRKGDLLDRFKLDECSSYRTPAGDNIIHMAARFGHEMIVEKAINGNGFHYLLSEKNSKGQSPLHLAAANGHLKVVQLIADQCRREASVENGDGDHRENLRPWRMKSVENGDTPLHSALRNGHSDVALLLLELDKDLASFVNYHNESPLYLAAESRSDHVLDKILMMPVDKYSVSGPLGQNPLHAAVKASRIAVQSLVKQRGDLIDKGDDNKKTAVHYAAERHLKNILELLLKEKPEAACLHDNDGFTTLHRAAMVGCYLTVKAILDYCPQSIEFHAEKDGKSVLHLAKMGSFPLKGCLKHADMVSLINERDHNGNTPLHLAVMESDEEKAFVLLSTKGINWRVRNKNHQTPIDLCQPADQASLKQHLIHLALKTHEEAWCSREGWTPELFKTDDMLRERFKKCKEEDLKQMINNMALVATLIVTVTFAAAFTVPGGYDQQTGNVLLMQDKAIQVFYISNIIAMLLSVSVIINYPLGAFFARTKTLSRIAHMMAFRLHICLAVTVVAFLSGVYAVSSHDAIWIAVVACIAGFCFVGFQLWQNWLWTFKKQEAWKRVKRVAHVNVG